MKDFFLNRLKEPSTWRGFIMCATAFGMTLSSEQAIAIATLGIALAGGAGVVMPDQWRK